MMSCFLLLITSSSAGKLTLQNVNFHYKSLFVGLLGPTSQAFSSTRVDGSSPNLVWS